MSEQKTPQPTIAELWDMMTSRLKDAKDEWFSDHGRETFRKEAETLRAQLIERCKRVDESGGYYTLFTLDEFVIAVHCKPNGSPKHRREDSSETAREMSAAYAFWAWELEQRQKEVSNG